MNKKDIKLWLDKMKIKNYSINDDLTVDVNGDVYINFIRLKEIPVQFNKISGGFYCHDNLLTTLEGAPKNVGDDFLCVRNQLTTLEGAPSSVDGSFYCSDNQLITLEGAPRSVGGGFYCHDNLLTTLEGAPSSVGGGFYCFSNLLNSLEGKPDYVGDGFLIDIVTYNRMFRNNKKWSLDDIDEIPAGDIDIKNKIYE